MLNTALCACGSGLRQIRCCDLDFAALPDAASLETLNPLAAEATTLFNGKKLPEAETLALKILDLAPNHRAALRVLFEVRKAQNRNPATEILARRLANLPGANAAQTTAANLQLAQLLIAQSRHADAEPAARAALKSTPQDATAHHVAGVIFTETGRPQPGEHHYRRALQLLGREDGMVLGNLAWNLKLQGRLTEAAAIYERALAIRPDNSRGIGGYAQVQAARANLPHAASLLDGALATWPADRSLRLLRALTDLLLNQPGTALARLNDPPETLLPAELIARGQAYERLGQTAEAIAHFATARRLQRERFGQLYAPGPFIKQAAQYQAFFTADRLAALPRANPSNAPQPIFLLGFPGSGTSLLEQLLAKIPGIAAAGDFAPIADLTTLPQLANYPDVLTDTLIGDGQDLPNQLRNHYHQNLAATGLATPEQNFVTNRAAGNAWHLGLIKLLFPDAPVIHLIRHPLDVAVSNFSQDKKLEANCNVSLAALAQHYALTMSVIRHYRGQLTLKYLPIRYEDLVTQPAATLRIVLDFAGADPAAIPAEFLLRANSLTASHRSPGHVITQQPIHDRSMFRYQTYQAAAPNIFADIRPILAPWIDELGYQP